MNNLIFRLFYLCMGCTPRQTAGAAEQFAHPKFRDAGELFCVFGNLCINKVLYHFNILLVQTIKALNDLGRVNVRLINISCCKHKIKRMEAQRFSNLAQGYPVWTLPLSGFYLLDFTVADAARFAQFLLRDVQGLSPLLDQSAHGSLH